MPPIEQPSLFDNLGRDSRSDNSGSAQSRAVPYWATRSVILYSELSQASPAQQKFYREFKKAFLNGQFINPEGNLNYIFLLIQDLYFEYTQHNDARLFTRQLKTLIKQYPEGKLIAERLYEARFPMYPSLSASEKEEIHDDWDMYLLMFGKQTNSVPSKILSHLRLTSSQQRTLDGINLRPNKFTQNDQCFRAVIALFFSVLNEMRGRCLSEGEELGKKIVKSGKLFIHQRTQIGPGTYQYESKIQSYQNTLLVDILYHCENKVRLLYYFPIRLHTESTILNPEITEFYQDWLYPLIEETITQKCEEIPKPTKQTEISLNLTDKKRWKTKLLFLLEEEPNRIQEITWVKNYGELVPHNKQAEYYLYLFQQLALTHPVLALEYYLNYRIANLLDTNSKAKPIPKNYSKKIFAHAEQNQAFNQILDTIKSTKQLPESIAAMKELFKPNRKTIELNKSHIQHIQTEHSETITLLNKYLYEEELETEVNHPQEIQPKLEAILCTTLPSQIQLSPLQEEVIQIINDNNNCLPETQVENFVRLRGSFIHVVIESINEACYEILEENLIEALEGNYVIEPELYRRIKFHK
jgi:hypothetical protein